MDTLSCFLQIGIAYVKGNRIINDAVFLLVRLEMRIGLMGALDWKRREE